MLVLIYGFLKLKYMIDIEEWQLINQTVLVEESDLTTAKNFNETALYGNISLALEFQVKRKVQTIAD